MTVMKYLYRLFLQYKDILQHMIDASVECGNNMKMEAMGDGAIAGHSVTFLLAGYETTASTLTFISYLLALHPDIQENLQTEIDDYFGNNPVCVFIDISWACLNYFSLSVTCRMLLLTKRPWTWSTLTWSYRSLLDFTLLLLGKPLPHLRPLYFMTKFDIYRFARECASDYRYKDIVIPAKSVVMISCNLLHMDPNIWEDPDTFDPLRY